MKTVSGLTRRTGWGRQLAKCATTPADSSQRLHTIYLLPSLRSATASALPPHHSAKVCALADTSLSTRHAIFPCMKKKKRKEGRKEIYTHTHTFSVCEKEKISRVYIYIYMNKRRGKEFLDIDVSWPIVH